MRRKTLGFILYLSTHLVKNNFNQGAAQHIKDLLCYIKINREHLWK